MAKTRSGVVNWQFAGVVAAAAVVFFLTLFGLARYVDETALQREKRNFAAPSTSASKKSPSASRR